MIQGTRTSPLVYAFLLGLLFFAYVHTARAADSRLVLYEEVVRTEIDPETEEPYEVYDTITTYIEDGGTYPVDLTQLYQTSVESSAAVDHTPPPNYTLAFKGELFFLDPVSGERQHIVNLGGEGGAYELTWNKTGNYELDVYAYDEPIPILTKGNWWQRFLAAVFPISVAHAQAADIFVETIQFSMTEEGAPLACCSNVLFIPGIKGSVLKSGSDRLWPPTTIQTFNGGISALALGENGDSVNPVVVDGILADFPTLVFSVPVYSPFVSFMDSLVQEGMIADWKPLPYDWRFTPEKILTDGIQTESGVVNVIAEIETLAANSDTGQVTIIAHSMGGLVGKAIIKKLEEEGKANLVDSFVMVGSPQLGTPQAVAGILHGGGESIGLGLIVNPVTSRRIAQNMQTAHDLLPSPNYFAKVTDPVITFNESADFTSTWREAWGNSIDSYTEFETFLTNQNGVRTKPSLDNLSSPEILRDDLVQHSTDFHNAYDNYAFPEHIRVVQIAGWGMPTVKAIEYRNEHLYPSYRTINTIEGDGTVVYPSAVLVSLGEKYFFNAEEYRIDAQTSIQHKDLLSAVPIQQLLNSIINETDLGLPALVSVEKPEVTDGSSKLLVSTYSPVILGVYDEGGNFTGIDPDQDLSSDFLFITEGIPGSTFVSFGESQQIFLPKDGKYTFKYKGIGTGSTTVEIATFENDSESVVVTYTDIPTSEETVATFDVKSESLTETHIEVDHNSDGVTDVEVIPDGEEPEEPSLEDLVVALKEKINEMDAVKSVKNRLLLQIKAFEKASTIEHVSLKQFATQGTLRVLKTNVELLEKKKKISREDADEILNIIALIKQKL